MAACVSGAVWGLATSVLLHSITWAGNYKEKESKSISFKPFKGVQKTTVVQQLCTGLLEGESQGWGCSMSLIRCHFKFTISWLQLLTGVLTQP